MEPPPSKKRKQFERTESMVPKQLKTYVNKAIKRRAEWKYHDVAVSGTASSGAFYGLNLLAIPQNATVNGRVGDKVQIQKVEWFWETRPGDNFNSVRHLLFVNNNNLTGGAGAAITSLTGPVDPDAGKVILDQNYSVWFVAADGATAQAEIIKYFRGKKKIVRNLLFASGVTAEPVNWKMGFQFHSDSAALPNPGVTGYIRIWFTDM